MRFLGVGDYCDLSSLYLRLIEEGHEVRVSISEPLCRDTLSGMVTKTEDWEADISWIREAGEDGIILFENVANHSGAKQDALREQGLHVVGGSVFGDRLENDRAFAQKVLQGLGMRTVPTFEFESGSAASAFIKTRPKRYVLKFNGDELGAADNYVGRFPDGCDVDAMIKAKFQQSQKPRHGFVLMDYVTGIEMGVGAFFNGNQFLTPACLDWEHKRFFPGDMGELTGEMGTVVTYERTARFFVKTLARMAPLLKASGYCGYINLNTIVNQEGIWPLEFTCRFGYPGYAILEPLQDIAWSKLLKGLVTRSLSDFRIKPGFAVGVVITTRPFPYVRTFVPEPIGLPVMFEGPLSDQDSRNIHIGELGLIDGHLVTAGYHGWAMVVTGTGSSIEQAQADAYRRAERVVLPNVRYRNDIGSKLAAGDYLELTRLGMLGD